MSETVKPSRPLSITELSNRAHEYEWNPSVPIKYWLRAAESIYQESQVYLQEENLGPAYMLLLRYSNLVLNHLPSHPEAKEPEAKRGLKKMKMRAPKVLGQLEEIKPKVQNIYDEWVKISAAQRDWLDQRNASALPHERHAANDPALSWNALVQANILDAGQNQGLAVDLARKEMRRRRRQAGVTDEEELRRRGAGVWDGWDQNDLDDEQELRKQMEAVRRHLDGDDATRRGDPVRSYRPQSRDSGTNITSPYFSQQLPADASSLQYKYPSVNRSTPVSYDSGRYGLHRETSIPAAANSSKGVAHIESSPATPDSRQRAVSATDVLIFSRQRGCGGGAAPPRPPKTTDVLEQKKVTFRPAAYLENGEPVRPVFLPKGLRYAFLKVAADNTRQGVEMCGILCGTPVNNALFIQCLLIPEQRCTPDTCETENESAVLDYCIANDYHMIGWIHTHPTQTCFMSSRDLHTHAGYQMMMPESIAIVCAPRHQPSWGIFRLTNPPGLRHIIDCTHKDTFHQHSIDRIYTSAGHPPGHVYESEDLEFVVHDLRG